MTSECTYKNWEELFAAFDSGKLDKNKFMIVMDNDNTSLRYMGDPQELGCSDEDELYDKVKGLFHAGGYCDIVEVLQAAGYPAEWC